MSGLADWLIEHVGPLRRAAVRREMATASLAMAKLADMGRATAAVPRAFGDDRVEVDFGTAPPYAAGLTDDIGGPPLSAGIDEPARRAKHAARLAEAMEKDAAAKYQRRPE